MQLVLPIPRRATQVDGSGCLDDTDAVVLVYPSNQGDPIDSSVTCNTADSGDPAVCDAADSLTFSFTKPLQTGDLDGFSLYRAMAADLDSPVVTDASCVAADFGAAAATGAPIAVVESPSFGPAPGTVAYYVIAHRRMSSSSAAPAALARLAAVADPVPRFVEPVCP